ncbi:HEPN domain-containing protein [Aestuariibaculum sediminum]|uniref:HEPN domain-containing protein n=1 Tax=Aestuariibaculum sediminum TaxID=2770637 RepID=A0A8J6Q0N7_9FLAO|nr:HEPN domain-containing protein [Aestuariibaculum sediminum]MBD0833348.1 HEPN domain-containing protein [Aestuariibaculum sediminum]
MNIITKMAQNDMSEHIIALINSILQHYPDYSCRVFTFSYACSEAQHGNQYFLNYCHEKDLVFKAEQENQIIALPDAKLTKLIENIKKDFKGDMSRMKAFKKGFHYFREQKQLPQSAFMAHQTFEQGYRVLERFICGKTKRCHSIKNHQTYVLKSLNKLEGAFQIESDVDSKLLDLLEDAYSSARYTNNYDIGKEDIEQLSQKLGLFIKEVEFWFNYELSNFEQNIKAENLNGYHNQTIKEPIPSVEREFLYRKLEFDNPYEMLCLAKSLMLTCATCLQDDVEPPMNVNGFYFEINEVLQLAIRLLPLNETSP